MRRWVIGVALAALPAGPLSAQCQGPGTICAEFDASEVVFLARVTQVLPADDREIGPLRPQTVSFEVLEDFKGTAGGGTTLMFDPAADHARLFSEEETVLVYARRSARPLWFAGCSRTRRVSPGDPELVTLRQLLSRSRGASLEGTLQIPASARPPAPARDVELGNLQLSVQALDGSGIVIAASQPSGYFLFPWLKPGSYRLRFESSLYVPVVRDVTVGENDRCRTLTPIAVTPR